MYKQCLSLVAGLLATAVFALSPGTAMAQHRGGRVGGANVSSGNWRGGNWNGGNWRGGNWDRGWGWGGRGWGWGGLGLGLAFGSPWYGGYGYGGGYWPGYASYGYSPYYYSYSSPYYSDSYPYYADTGSNYYGSPMYYSSPMSSDMSPSYGYGAPAPAQDNEAHVRVIVPPNARVWFDNSATQQTGSVRYYDSPELTPGKDYTYDVKAQWTDNNGKEVTQTRHVDVRANAGTTVDFMRPMPKAGSSATPNK